ncbi:SdpI family protein [Heyndrickxia acidiproducens]|uniref:SdpI family protein n=1 Tax=Heyndrickxia acidiproducens TaxID=1121084 RepID=UPI00036F91F8|nr:SdpI family protein [Heyndrickxia acidiproducens]
MRKNLLTKSLFILTILISAISYPFLPDMLAVQFGSDNSPTNVAPKIIGLLIIPLVMILLYFSHGKRNEFIHSANLYESRLMYNIASIFLFVTQIMMILINLGFEIHFSRIIKIALGVIFIVLGNYLYRAVRNYKYGIKNKWTLSNNLVWKKTHKLSSIIFVIAGIAVILINLIWNNEATEYTTGVLIGCVALCHLTSYLLYHKYKNNT